MSQKWVALGNKSRFLFLPLPEEQAQIFVLTEWSVTSMYISRGTAAVALRSRHEVGFSSPAEVYAPQCVLSTKAALSSLSVRRQKCCAAALLTAVWLSVAGHLRVPCWLTEPRTTQPQDCLFLPMLSKWAERYKTHPGAVKGTKHPEPGLWVGDNWKKKSLEHLFPYCVFAKECVACLWYWGQRQTWNKLCKKLKIFIVCSLLHGRTWKCILLRCKCVTHTVPSSWN